MATATDGDDDEKTLADNIRHQRDAALDFLDLNDELAEKLRAVKMTAGNVAKSQEQLQALLDGNVTAWRNLADWLDRLSEIIEEEDEGEEWKRT